MKKHMLILYDFFNLLIDKVINDLHSCSKDDLKDNEIVSDILELA